MKLSDYFNSIYYEFKTPALKEIDFKKGNKKDSHYKEGRAFIFKSGVYFFNVKTKNNDFVEYELFITKEEDDYEEKVKIVSFKRSDTDSDGFHERIENIDMDDLFSKIFFILKKIGGTFAFQGIKEKGKKRNPRERMYLATLKKIGKKTKETYILGDKYYLFNL